ncbi:hypothetical protein D9M70_406220 [compost metagenome]
MRLRYRAASFNSLDPQIASELEHAHIHQPIIHLPDRAGRLCPGHGVLCHCRPDSDDRDVLLGFCFGSRAVGHRIHPGLRAGLAGIRRPSSTGTPTCWSAGRPGTVRNRQWRQRTFRELHRPDDLARRGRHRRRCLSGHGDRRVGRRLHDRTPGQGHRHHHGRHGQWRGTGCAIEPAPG